MHTSRTRLSLSLFAFSVLATLALAASALALETHVFASSFTGSAPNALSDPQGIAVEEATGDVYVVDSANDRVEIFSPSGAFISAFGTAGSGNGQLKEPTQIAADNSGGLPGDVYILDNGNGRVEVFNAKGEYQSQIQTPTATGIAVDVSGNLWVSGGKSVEEFPAGTPPGTSKFRTPETHSPGLAIDPSGDVYLLSLNAYCHLVEKYEPNGSFLGYVDECGKALAADPANSDLYVLNSGSVEHYLAPVSAAQNGGPPNDSFGSTASGTPASDALVQGAGIAVDGSTGNVYVTEDASNGVDIFVPATLPEATTESPTSLATTTAVLNGTVNPDGIEVSSCEFEWGIEPGVFPNTVACSSAPGSGTESVAVSAEISGLTPSSTYHYRLIATNANGKGTSNDGQEVSFRSAGSPAIGSESYSGLGSSRVTLEAKVDPDGLETQYHFEYGPTVAYGKSVPIPDGSIAPGFSEQPVSVGVTGLSASTTYHFRVVASNAGGPPVDGPDQTITTLPAAVIDSESVSDVTATSVVLEAQINPLGASTTCRFQYVTEASFQSTGYDTATSVSCPMGLGAGETEVPTNVHLQSLTPGTTYDYRVIATNTLGTDEGADHTFTTQRAGELVLPDARQWELVSPPDKHGAPLEALGTEASFQAAVSGGAFAFATRSPTESVPQGYALPVEVLATRGAAGWSSRDLTIPHETATELPVGSGGEYRLFSGDLSRAVIQPQGSFTACQSAEGVAQPCLSPDASEQTAFLASSYLNGNPGEPCLPPAMSCYQPLVTGAPGFANVPEGTFFGGHDSGGNYDGPAFRGATPDLSHIVLASSPLTSPSGGSLYEASPGRPPGEQITPISLLPKGEGGGPAFGAYFGSTGGTNDARHAISDDGSRVFWSVPNGEHPDRIYVRDVTKGEGGETLRINSGGESGFGGFQDASSDGSRVFYTEGGGLFECAITEQTGKLKCATTELGSGVESTILGASEDGTWVYFVATTTLAEHAVAGKSNLYVRHDGVTSLVAVLSASDYRDWSGQTNNPSLEGMTARVSPDGRWVSLMSQQDLTGYDTHDAFNGRPDEEVYLYHAPEDLATGSGTLTCASCDPSGARPVGEEGAQLSIGKGGVVGAQTWNGSSTRLAANVPEWDPYELGASPVYQPRYLSDSGRLFFNARDPLVPQAANGTWDVYEFEPEGVGPAGATCGPAAGSGSEVFEPARTAEVEGHTVLSAAGCVALISGGESGQESGFLDASEDGSDVFFVTTAKLVGQDIDNAYDVYDAHECTSESPCFPPAAAQPPACSTEASCKAAPTPQPEVFGPPASATFSGPGNPPPPSAAVNKITKKTVKCSKPKKLSKGRCVKPKPKQRHKAKKR